MRRLMVFIENIVITATIMHLLYPLSKLSFGEKFNYFDNVLFFVFMMVAMNGFVQLLSTPFISLQNPTMIEQLLKTGRIKWPETRIPEVRIPKFVKSSLSTFPVAVIIAFLFIYLPLEVIGKSNRLFLSCFYLFIWLVLGYLLFQKSSQYEKYAHDEKMRFETVLSLLIKRIKNTWQELRSYPSFLVFFSCFFFSTKTQTRILYPLIADMMTEVDKAKNENKPLKAKWEALKGVSSFWITVTMLYPLKVMVVIRKIWAK